MTVDPMRTSWDAASPKPGAAERELAVFENAAVVQVVGGDAHRPDALVTELHGATVRVTDQRILAADGDFAWAWLVTDIAAVVHGADEPWTIFDVPGISDFGVAVPRERVAEFRESLAHLRNVEVVQQTRAAAIPPPPPMFPPPVTGPVPLVINAAESTSSAALAPLGVADHHAHPAPHSPFELSALAGLDARHISAWFGSHQVLDRVSLHMAAGEVTALIGPSGCGKSTFLRILNRMHEMIPSAAMAGEVLLDGHDIYDPERKLTDARREIGMVFQKPNPFPAMSIYDNVLASLRLTGAKASDRREGRARRDLPEQGRAVERGPRSAAASPAAACPAGSSSGCASPARWPSGRGCC